MLKSSGRGFGLEASDLR